LPRNLEINAGNIGQNVDCPGIAPETKEAIPVREVLCADTLKCRAKFSERRKRSLSIGRVGFDEKVEVLRKAGLRVMTAKPPTIRYLTP
jgi:hypothetical protein